MPSPTKLDQLITKVIEAEGSEYTNHPSDRGGPTKYGVTLATLRTIPFYAEADADDVKHLTLEKAKDIYKSIYAEPFMFISDDKIFQFVFNGAIQHGVRGMVKIIQRALQVADDGVLGPMTRDKLARAGINPQWLLATLVAARCNYYANILSRDPSQRVFCAGWLNRIAKDLT